MSRFSFPLDLRNRRPSTMSSTAENLACHTLVQIQALLGPHVQIGQLSQDTGLLLARDDLIQHVGEISPKDQERLVDRVDQVCFKIVPPFSCHLFTLDTFRCTRPSTHETQSACSCSEPSAVQPSDSLVRPYSPRDLKDAVASPSRPEH